MFFSFDGVDGVGKSTQIHLFCQWLREIGQDVVTCRDPGGTPLGEQIRSILLDSHDIPIGRRAEMLLYMAARAQMVEQVIRPALATGQTVVSDRFLIANIVYQGHAGGLDVEEIRNVGRVATGGIHPQLTFLLDMDVTASLARLDRSHDRMEAQGVKYLERVREGFLVEARRQPTDIVIINADQSVEAVQAQIRATAAGLLASSPHFGSLSRQVANRPHEEAIATSPQSDDSPLRHSR